MQIDAWIAEIESIPAPPQREVSDIIEAMHDQIRSDLAKVLGCEGKQDPYELETALRRAGGHSVANVIRGLRERRAPVGVAYDTVVRDAASAHKLQVRPYEATAAIEERIVRQVFSNLLESMPENERQAMLARLREEAKAHGKSFTVEAVSGAALLAAKASGFGVYMMATTALGAVSKTLGLGLGFGTYVGLVQAISLFMPVGIAGVGAMTVYKAGAPNLKKTFPAVLLVAATRLELAELLQDTMTRLRARQAELQTHELELGSVAARRVWRWSASLASAGEGGLGRFWGWLWGWGAC